MDLKIDPTANQLVINGWPISGRRRWEATVLATLVSGGHRSAATACSAAQLGLALTAAGQVGTLTRKQWSLIWQSVAAMFDAAGAAPALAARLRNAPRTATVGPWWWVRRPGDRIAIGGEPAPEAPNPLPRLAASGQPQDDVHLCRQFLICQGLFADGHLEAVVQALAPGDAWRGAAPELQALRQVRLAEAQLLRHKFGAARAALDGVEQLSLLALSAGEYLGPYLPLLRHRIAYAEAPTSAYSRILTALLPATHRSSTLASREADGHSRALTLNLAALCERRWIEQNASRASATELARRVTSAQRYWSAAIYGFLVSNQHMHVQDMCSNIGYFYQQLNQFGIEPTIDLALEWYGLAQAWHNRFDMPDNTVWEYVFIGDLWLQREDVRAKLACPDSSVAWAGRLPNALDFYQYSAGRAREIGDPRQIAHTALNLWRYAREFGRMALVRQARDALESVLAAHPNLRQTLLAEGYSLP